MQQSECPNANGTRLSVALVDEAVDGDHSWDDEEFDYGWGHMAVIQHAPKPPQGLTLSKRLGAFKDNDDEDYEHNSEPNESNLNDPICLSTLERYSMLDKKAHA